MSAPGDRTTDEPRPGNLPVAASSFVGRVADLEAIAGRFDDGAQLVTVTGLGGVGKTRVAHRFAEAHADGYAAPGGGGVWFCDLSAARDASAACAAVAAALGVPQGADAAALADQLGRALSRRGRTLLVLDNFEQLVDVAAAVLGRWLAAAPRARFLVTSRVALGVAGEHLWPLRPLALPPADLRDEARLAATESVELFVRRARQRRPDLPLGRDDLLAVAEVVRRLDGIPLAIELAAARVTVLSPAQLRDRLVRRLDLLVRHGDAGRHASMRRALTDTYEQLGPAEQTCLAGCTVFAGGFSLASAEAVLAPEVGPVLPALESLCLHSLVRATPCADLDGELRFSLYETIREFAAEHLAADPALAARLARRHAAVHAGLVRALAVPVATAGGQARARLDLDLDNLVAAHAHALAAGDAAAAADALTIAEGAARPLIRRGLARQALRLLDEAIDRAREAAAPAALAAALLARGRAHRMLGARPPARASLEEGLALAAAAGEPTLEALGHMRIGELVEIDGATEEARTRFTTALACLDRAPDAPLRRLHEAECRTFLAHAYRREGRLEQAEREIHRALAIHRAADRSDDLPAVLYEAGVIAWFRGRHDDALARYDEGLELARSLDARHARGALLYVRAILLQERGDLDQAFAFYVRAMEPIRESGNLYLEASALYYFAGAHLERGQHDDAGKLLGRALALFRGLGVPRYLALTEGCRAVLLAVAGDAAAADACLAAAEQAAEACRSEPALTATVAIHRLATRIRREPPAQRERRLAEARALAAAHPSDDSRFALRVATACADAPRASGEPLRVRPDGRAFRPPGAPADVDLRRRAPLQRIVRVLARRRLDAPGEALGLEELLAAGWPGERVRDSAGANRVHVALSTLRNLGLRGLLVTSADGYALSSAVPCVLDE
jgi:predicted ATPase/Tfp pilus assembly protein PilF